jgi:hypothetical protein
LERLNINKYDRDVNVKEPKVILKLKSKSSRKALKESTNHNMPKIDALLEKYKEVSNGLEVIRENIRGSRRTRHKIHRKENTGLKLHDEHVSFSLHIQQKPEARKSMINSAIDLLVDSPTSMQIRKPPQPYPYPSIINKSLLGEKVKSEANISMLTKRKMSYQKFSKRLRYKNVNTTVIDLQK